MVAFLRPVELRVYPALFSLIKQHCDKPHSLSVSWPISPHIRIYEGPKSNEYKTKVVLKKCDIDCNDSFASDAPFR